MRELGIISDTWDGLRPTAIEPWMLAFLQFAATNPDFRFGLLSDGYLRSLNEMYKSSHSPPVLRRLSREARTRRYTGMGDPGTVGSPRLRVYSPHVAAGPPPAAPPGQHVSAHQQFRPREAAPPSLATGLNLRDGGDGVMASGWTYQGAGSLPPPWACQRSDGYHLVRGDGYQSLVRAPTAGGGPVPTSSASVGYGHGYSIGGYSKIGMGAEPAFFHPCGYTSSHSAVLLPDGMPDGAAAHDLTMQPPLGSVVRLPDGTSLSSRDLVSSSGGVLSRQRSTSTAHEQYDLHASTYPISTYPSPSPCTAPRDINSSMLPRVRSLPTLANEPHRGCCSRLSSRPEPRGLLSRSLGAVSDGGAPATYAGSGGNGCSGGCGMAIESFREWEARRMSHREHGALHRVEMPPPNTAPPLRSLAIGTHTGSGSGGGGMRPRRRSPEGVNEGANGPMAPITAPAKPSAPPATPGTLDYLLSCPPTATLFLPPSRGVQGSGLPSCASANSFSPAGSTSSPSLLPLRRPPKAPAESRWETSGYYGHYYGAHSSSQYPSSFVLGPTPQNSAEGSALTGGSSGVQHACLAYGTPIFGTLDRPRTGAMLPKPVVGTACFDSRQVLSRWATRYVETPRPGATRAERDTSGLVPPTRVERKGSTPYL